MNEMTIVVLAGAAFSALLLVLGLGNARSESSRRTAKRIDTVRQRRGGGGGGSALTAATPTSVKRAQARSVPVVEQLVGRFLPRQSALRQRLARTGRDIPVGTYALINLGIGAVGFGIAAGIAGLPLSVAGFIGLAIGVGVPHFSVGIMASRRQKRFIALLPDAIDLIVRGLKSGLPVSESIAAVGNELPDPLGIEFRRITDTVRFGRQLEDTLWDTAIRLAIPEFNFFVISLSVQRETGGNLAETLANLSDILRKRRQMKLKVKAMSSEARASAYILGSLPFIMFAIIYLMNPGYADDLFTDPRGHMMLVGGGVSLLTGIGVMFKMVKFEI